MTEELERERQGLKQDLDEMKIQLTLGRAEAVDALEERKHAFIRFVDETSHEVAELGSPTSERIREKLTHLREQLSLGRMNSHNIYCAQRTQIVDAIDEVGKELEGIAADRQTGPRNPCNSFTRSSRDFLMKMEVAALNLGPGALLTPDKVEETVDKTNQWLDQFSVMTQDEIREAREYIKDHLALYAENKNT